MANANSQSNFENCSLFVDHLAASEKSESPSIGPKTSPHSRITAADVLWILGWAPLFGIASCNILFKTFFVTM